MVSDEIKSSFPIPRESLIASVDTVHFSTTLPLRFDPNELLQRGFSYREGNFDRVYFLNPIENTPPNLTVTKSPIGRWRLYVNANLPRMAFGNNLCLPLAPEIERVLDELSSSVSNSTKVDFDSRKAKLRRIDYATNLSLNQEDARAFLERLRRLVIPRFKYDDTQVFPTTVYFNSGQRMLRIYDKSTQLSIDSEIRTIRAELALNKPSTINDFAVRTAKCEPTGGQLLSSATIELACSKLYDLLGIESFLPNQRLSIAELIEKRQCTVSEARAATSFAFMMEEFGHDRTKHLLGDSKFNRELRYCQKLGY